MVSVQTLGEGDRRVLAAWAADCAARVLPLVGPDGPAGAEARDAIERARAYSRGELDTAEQIKRRFDVGRVPPEASPAARAAIRSAAQAAAVAHMGAHALGAAGYAAVAVELSGVGPDTDTAGGLRETAAQVALMTEAVRAALARLPRAGSDRAGPLGPGLLTRGAVGAAIARLQDAVRPDGREAVRPDDREAE